MRDIPMFTTENGVASLFLRQIPTHKTAYVSILSSCTPDALLKECCDFCIAAGAENVLAKGQGIVNADAQITVVEMARSLDGLPETDACLFPVQEQTFEQWRGIYNQRMQDVPGARTVSAFDKKEILDAGAYFVHKGGKLLGIGLLEANRIRAIAGVEPGAGKAVLLALCSALTGECVVLQVALENTPAVKLYEKMGFLQTRVVEQWVRIK